MFTVDQIKAAHSKIKSGAEFPAYIQDIKQLGVISYVTWVKDSHTDYAGENNYQVSSKPVYGDMQVTDTSDARAFTAYLKTHQQGQTDYLTFCRHCAETGVEKWIVDLLAMTCTYFDKQGNKLLVEEIPVNRVTDNGSS